MTHTRPDTGDSFSSGPTKSTTIIDAIWDDIEAIQAEPGYINVSEPLPELFVAPTGDDGNDGRFDAPFLTLAAAIAALPSPGSGGGKGGKVNLRPGKYLVGSAITGIPGLYLHGLGRGQYGTADYGPVLLANANSMSVLDFAVGAGVHQTGPVIEGITFDANGKTGVTLINAIGWNRLNIQNCSFRTAAIGIYLDDYATARDSAWHNFIGNQFENNDIGIYGHSGYGFTLVGGDCNHGSGDTFIQLGETGVSSWQHTRIIGAKCDGGSYFIDSQAAWGIEIIANHLENVGQGGGDACGIRIQHDASVNANTGKMHSLMHNFFTGSGAQVGILAKTGCADNTQLGNKFVNMGTKVTDTAFSFDQTSRGGGWLTPVGTANTMVWKATKHCVVQRLRTYRSGGTSASVNARKNGTSTFCSSDVVTSDGTWVDSTADQNTPVAVGDEIEIMLTALVGTPSQVIVQIDLLVI